MNHVAQNTVDKLPGISNLLYSGNICYELKYDTFLSHCKKILQLY